MRRQRSLSHACCNDQPHSPPTPPSGTAIVQGKKGQYVWTDGADEEALSHGVFDTYVQRNLRYSQARSGCGAKSESTCSPAPCRWRR